MTIKEFLDTEKNINERTFGKFIRQRRMEVGLSIRDVATALHLTHTYVCDIENGNRSAPTLRLKEMIEVLKIKEDEVVDFKDLAYKSKNALAPELIHYLINSKEARKAIRILIDKEVNGEQFLEIVENNI